MDTGFSGSPLLSIEGYLRLGLQLYEKAVSLVAGGLRAELRASRAVLKLGSYVYPATFTRQSLPRGAW